MATRTVTGNKTGKKYEITSPERAVPKPIITPQPQSSLANEFLDYGKPKTQPQSVMPKPTPQPKPIFDAFGNPVSESSPRTEFLQYGNQQPQSVMQPQQQSQLSMNNQPVQTQQTESSLNNLPQPQTQSQGMGFMDSAKSMLDEIKTNQEKYSAIKNELGQPVSNEPMSNTELLTLGASADAGIGLGAIKGISELLASSKSAITALKSWGKLGSRKLTTEEMKLVDEAIDAELSTGADRFLKNPEALSPKSVKTASGIKIPSASEAEQLNSVEQKTMNSWIVKLASEAKKPKYVLGVLTGILMTAGTGYVGMALYSKSMIPNDMGDKLADLKMSANDAEKRGDYNLSLYLHQKIQEAVDPEVMQEFKDGEPVSDYFKGAWEKVNSIGETSKLSMDSIQNKLEKEQKDLAEGDYYNRQDKYWNKYLEDKAKYENELQTRKEEENQKMRDYWSARDEQQKRYQQERDAYYESLRAKQVEEADKQGKSKLGFGIL